MLICVTGSNNYNQAPIHVPLTSVDCRVDVVDREATLTYKQNFLNREDKQLEVVYTFPTLAEAAVYSLVAKNDDGTIVKCMVKEKEEAKKEYNDAISSGDTAYYADRDNGRSFRLLIGNLGPKCGVEITVKLVAELNNEEDYHKIRLAFPTTLGTAYVPEYRYSSGSHVPSVTNPTKVSHKPYNMSLSGKIRMGSKIVSIDSKTHKIKLSDFEEHSTSFEITDLDELNRDVVITIERKSSTTSAFTQELESPLVNPELRFCTAVNLLPDFENMAKVNINACEYILCLDKSGSMGHSYGYNPRSTSTPKQCSMDVCRTAAQHFVANIPNQATFRIFAFDRTFTEFQCKEENIIARKKAASDWLETITANGGTEILPVLKEIYATVDKRKNTVIIILTDGDIENSADVFKLVRSNPNATVFSVGIGSSVDQNLVKGLATHGKGRAEFIGEGDKNTVDIVKSQLRNAQSTLLKHQNDYKVEIDTMGGRTRNVPSVFAPLYEKVDNTLYVFSEFEPATVKFTTCNEDGSENVQVIHPVKLDSTNETTMHRIAGIKLIDELTALEKSNDKSKPKLRGSKLNDMMVKVEQVEEVVTPTTDETDLRNQIISVSTDLNILSNHTAYIGVKENINKLTGDMELREVPLQLAQRESERYEDLSVKSFKCLSSLQSQSEMCLESASLSMPRSKSISKSKSKSKSKSNSFDKCGVMPEYFDDMEEKCAKVKSGSYSSSKKSSRSMIARLGFDSDDSSDSDSSPTTHQPGFFESAMNYFARSTKSTSTSTSNLSNSTSNLSNSTPKPVPVIIVTRAVNGAKLGGGLLIGTVNGSFMELVMSFMDPDILKPLVLACRDLAIDDIIQLTGESDSSLNGFYKIVNLGSVDESWTLERI